MATPLLSPTRRQVDELAVISGLGVAKLGLIRRQIAGHGPTISRRKIQETIASVLSPTESRQLSSFLLGAAVSMRRRDIEAKDFVEGISAFIESRQDRNKRFAGWEECRGEVTLLLDTQAVRLVAKAFDISYDFERIFTEARLITSLRPVFDLEDKETIVGSTVVQTLRLEYASHEGERASLSIALDLDDVRQLGRLCNEGLKKAKASVDFIESKCAVEAIMIGEKDE